MYQKHVLTDGLKRIHLYEVSHVGEGAFYKRLYQNLSDDFDSGFTIHQEGVDMPKHLSAKMRKAYTRIANCLEASMQERPKVAHKIVDLTHKDMPRKAKRQFKWLLRFLTLGSWALLFLSQVEPAEIKKMQTKLRNPVPDEDDKQFNKLMREFAPELRKFMVDDRNGHAVLEAINEDTDVSMVWGKAHAPGMITLFAQHGFTLEDSSVV